MIYKGNLRTYMDLQADLTADEALAMDNYFIGQLSVQSDPKVWRECGENALRQAKELKLRGAAEPEGRTKL